MLSGVNRKNPNRLRAGAVSISNTFKKSAKTKSLKQKHSTIIIKGVDTIKELLLKYPEIKVNHNDDWICTTCGMTFTTVKTSNIVDHFKTRGHKNFIDKNASVSTGLQNTFRELSQIIRPEIGPLSRTSTADMAHRMFVCKCFLKAGVAFEAFNELKYCVVNYAAIGSPSTLKKYIPAVRDSYHLALLNEVTPPVAEQFELTPNFVRSKAFRPISVLFDSSLIFHETYVFGLRIVDEYWNAAFRVVKVAQYDETSDALSLCKKILNCIFDGKGPCSIRLDSHSVMGWTRDGAAVNGAALRILSQTKCQGTIDIVCSSHAVDLAGKKFQTPCADEYWLHYEKLFLDIFHSAPFALLQQLGVNLKSYSKTRWGSRCECEIELLKLLLNEKFYQFVASDENSHLFDQTHGKAFKEMTLHRGIKWLTTVAEFASRVSLGLQLIKTAYTLEEENASIFDLYDAIYGILGYIRSPDLSLVETISKFVDNARLGSDDIVEDNESSSRKRKVVTFRGRLVRARKNEDSVSDSVTARRITNDEELAAYKNIGEIETKVTEIITENIKEPLKYLKTIYDTGRMHNVTTIADAARYFHPKYKLLILALTPASFAAIMDKVMTNMTGSATKEQIPIKLFKDHKNELVNKLGAYQQLLTDTPLNETEPNALFKQFWRIADAQEDMSCFCYVAKVLYSLVPSSGYVERLHSILNASYSSQQSCVLTDVLETTLMVKLHPEPTTESLNGAMDKLPANGEIESEVESIDSESAGSDDDI